MRELIVKLAWATDIHLDFITNPEQPVPSAKNLDVFCKSLLQGKPDAIFLTGDISLSKHLRDHLFALEARIPLPIYFVLGNHDFWLGKIEEVRKQMNQVTLQSDRLKYLSAMPYVALSNETVMVGHDGWYDGFNGNPYASGLQMNDWYRISDFVEAGAVNRQTGFLNLELVLSVARNQAVLAAKHITFGIKSAISQRKPKKIIVVTHVPPFTGALHRAPADPQALYPWYSSKTMGDMLLTAAKANPNITFEIFSGHVHAKHEEQITPNLLFRSGGAEYGSPTLQGVFDIF